MKAIVFDVDGVIIGGKDESGKYLWMKNIEADLGLNQDQIRQIYSNWSLVIKGLVDTQQYFNDIFTRLNIALPADTFIEYWIKHDSHINTEILPVLESLKGRKLYMGTNQDSYRTTFLQKKFSSYFDGIFSSYQIGAIKPEPEFFKHIETTLSLQSTDIAFIDDSISHVQAAAKLGWKCHHYQNIEGLKKFFHNL
jgi:putative hydrolase of the HAD superfamily